MSQNSQSKTEAFQDFCIVVLACRRHKTEKNKTKKAQKQNWLQNCGYELLQPLFTSYSLYFPLCHMCIRQINND